ncbi:hypothetical protein DITRI_Ditri14bG0110400 [Diplodiscus trichospermus]
MILVLGDLVHFFLDSLTVTRASSGPLFHYNQPTKDAFASHSSQFNSINTIGLSLFEKPSTESETVGTFTKQRPHDFPSAIEYPDHFSAPAGNNGDPLVRNVANENILKKKLELYSTKQNVDFAALELHIEDLTQEEFSLQKALEASHALAEYLAAEDSSLTDGYNQQVCFQL